MIRKRDIIPLSIIFLSFIAAIFLYPHMPERLASHWNSKGEVDGYMPKFWGVFLMPIISLALLALFYIIPNIDPLKKNINEFRKYFDMFIILILLFFFYIYSLTVIWNLGYSFNMVFALMPAFSVLFYYVGILLKKSKRNWFIGIRTPWTLSNDAVWEKTHNLGSILFKIIAFLFLFSIFIPDYSIWILLVVLVVFVIFLFVYSYVIYQKETKNHKARQKY